MFISWFTRASKTSYIPLHKSDRELDLSLSYLSPQPHLSSDDSKGVHLQDQQYAVEHKAGEDRVF